MMKKVFLFIMDLVKEVQQDEVGPLAGELTYKLMLALFPFIIFLMALVGFFNLEIDTALLANTLPEDILEIFDVFIVEVVHQRNVSLLSTSLLVTVFSASSGFNAVIRGVNKAYGQKETRNFIAVRLLSMGLMLIFALSLIGTLVLFIFRDDILNMLASLFTLFDGSFGSIFLNTFLKYLSSFSGVLGVLGVLLFATMIIYKTASCKKITLWRTLPGALFSVLVWALASKVFSIYVKNFGRFSKIYGSIASIFILMFWLNLISFVLLTGCEINALLDDSLSKKGGEP